MFIAIMIQVGFNPEGGRIIRTFNAHRLQIMPES
jgi:hypothetical protein